MGLNVLDTILKPISTVGFALLDEVKGLKTFLPPIDSFVSIHQY